MIDLIWLTAVSNLIFAGLLAIAALMIGRQADLARVAHVLWVLVLVKLVTPPVVSVAPVEQHTSVVATPSESMPHHHADTARATTARRERTRRTTRTPSIEHEVSHKSWTSIAMESFANVWDRVRYPATFIWAAGSIVILLYSIYRCRLFAQLLAETRAEASPKLESMTTALAVQLEVKRPPQVQLTTANVSPMILPTLPRTTMVVPSSLLTELSDQQLRLILAHELGHMRRGDQYVRVLEWLSWLVMWWNPMVWFAQRHLRECEEHSCDMLVLTKLKAKTKHYAAAILRAVEAISPPATRPPAMASAINSGGTLERRMRKMLSTKQVSMPSWWTRLPLIAMTMVVLPLGIVSAQDYEKVYKRLQKSVNKGEITGEQADLMMIALKTAANDFEEEVEEEHVFDGDLEEIGAKLKGLVAAGKLSEEEAWEKWKYFQREYTEQEEDEESDEEEEEEEEEHELRGVAIRLKMAVRDERMTEQEAREYWIEILEDRGLREDFDEDEWEDIEDEDEREEDEEDRSDEWGFNPDREEELARHELEGIELRLRLAVHEGDLSEEEAREQYEEALEEFGHHDHVHDGHEHEHEVDEEREEAFDEIREQLVSAIRSGRVSPERLEEEWDDILEDAEETEDEWEDEEEDDDDDEDEEDEDEDDDEDEEDDDD